MEKLFEDACGFILIMFLLSIVVFYFARLAPGDPLESFYGDRVETMTPAGIRSCSRTSGVGWSYLDAIYSLAEWSISKEDFGISLKYKMPAMQVIAPR